MTLALILAMVPAALARQDDPRLDDLFAQLQSTDNPREALLLQQQIWQVWTLSGSDTVDVLMSRGNQAMAARQYDAALKLFNSVIELDPEFAEGWNKRATLYYLMGRYNDSVVDIQHTLVLEPRHFGALSGLGMIYDAIEDDEGALKAFRQALSVNPHLPGARKAVIRLKKKLKGEGI